MALIAKELARREKFDVTMVVADHGQPHIEKRAGVVLYSWEGRAIWNIPSPDERFGDQKNGSKPAEPFSARLRRRFNQLRLSLIRSSLTGQVGDYGITPDMISIYSEVDADIYIVPGNSEFSTEVAFYCQQRGKRYVFLAGSDMDYSPEYKLHPEKQDIYGVSYFLKTYAIESADAHIVQNEQQASLLKNGYDRTCTVIKNPIDLHRKFPRDAAKGILLWVGKSDEVVKRPSLILELARQLPQFKLVMIMPCVNDEIHSKLLEEANELSNVTLLEYVPFKQIESYFASAYLHLNTSIFEGFPNTFLQAAKYGVPTVSLKVDPGGMFSQHNCGVVCMDNFKVFKQTVQSLMTDTESYETYSKQALEYVKKNHDKDIIILQYEKVLHQIYEQWEKPVSEYNWVLAQVLGNWITAKNGTNRSERLKGPFQWNDGLCWTFQFPSSKTEGDSLSSPRKSNILLYEGNRLLGPAHAHHTDIRKKGGGSYSHWESFLYFSTSDGSDPNSNGRTYTVIWPE